jgi:dinuclear metal center YbgI/SA1388 family protein
MKVKDIVAHFEKLYPPKDAIPDDRIGLLVGDPNEEAFRIAVALDSSVDMVNAAADAACNMLIAHHPAYWPQPATFLNETSTLLSDGANIYAAIKRGVSLLGVHTNMDCSPICNEMLLAPVGFKFDKALSPVENPASKGASLGQIGKLKPKTKAPTLKELAERYDNEFGAVAKVWGNPESKIKKLATCSGAGAELAQLVAQAGVDCYVTGEAPHHVAWGLHEAGVALIELGHDVSELPYRKYIYEALISAKVKKENIEILDPTAIWWQV